MNHQTPNDKKDERCCNSVSNNNPPSLPSGRNIMDTTTTGPQFRYGNNNKFANNCIFQTAFLHWKTSKKMRSNESFQIYQKPFAC
mmetsp:Transcript_10820/g.16548  ORF Transcript_10820/g.16548 Transcript_10820/m.16548 type:complete len:85 (+) Transcript_10820:72-326(+)